jgi:hypothetical protein
MKKIRQHVIAVLLATLLGSCQQTATATIPPPLTVTTDLEFTLAPGQSAALIDAVFTIRLIGITNDERCPSDIECAVSGPVSLSITVQKGGGDLTTINLQTFTGTDGRAPEARFEGIQDRVEFEGYLIQVKEVLPYPARAFDEINDSDYRVSFLVTEQ